MKSKSLWEDIVLYSISILVLSLFAYFFHMSYENSDYNPEHYEMLIESFKFQDDSTTFKSTNYYKAQLLLNHKRYEAVMVSLKNRFLIRTVAFMLGSIIILLGSLVVIRGVRDPGSGLEIEGAEKLKLKFQSSTPGLFLALFGTLIVLTTIIAEKKYTTTDNGIQSLETSFGYDNYYSPKDNLPLVVPAPKVKN